VYVRRTFSGRHRIAPLCSNTVRQRSYIRRFRFFAVFSLSDYRFDAHPKNIRPSEFGNGCSNSTRTPRSEQMSSQINAPPTGQYDISLNSIIQHDIPTRKRLRGRSAPRGGPERKYIVEASLRSSCCAVLKYIRLPNDRTISRVYPIVFRNACDQRRHFRYRKPVRWSRSPTSIVVSDAEFGFFSPVVCAPPGGNPARLNTILLLTRDRRA